MKDIRKLRRVMIVASDMNLRAFKLHDCVRSGYIFGIEHAYIANTRARTPMYELCGATGKHIVWGTKIMRKWTMPVSTWGYLWERYGPNPIRVLIGALKEIAE